jgi:SET domain
MSYKPLPDCLTIKESPIDGLRLFATQDILLTDARTPEKWVTHLHFTAYDEEIFFRSPIGGYINHSDNPNCTLNRLVKFKMRTTQYYLQPLKDIKAGEELTLDYTRELCGVSGYGEEEWLK